MRSEGARFLDRRERRANDRIEPVFLAGKTAWFSMHCPEPYLHMGSDSLKSASDCFSPYIRLPHREKKGARV